MSNILPIPGLTTTKHVYDSTGIQTLEALPKRLGILGGGNIGLEFAGLYNRLGSQVTVLDAATSFLPRVEPSIAKLAKQYMEEDGIVFEQGVRTSEVKNDGDEVVVVTDKGDFRFDALLYATGMVAITLKHVELFQLLCSSIDLWHKLVLLKIKPEQQVDRLLSRNFQLLACLVAMLMAICAVPSKLW